MMKIFDKINFKEPKYMLPAILYVPLLVASYFIFDLFHAETAEIPDKTMQMTEYLNPDLPDARIKGDIGSKYENMAKSWGKIQDYSAVDNIEREESDDNKEEYESQYTMDDIALLDEQQQEKAAAAQIADAKTREQEALAELEKALAEARLKGRNEVLPPTDTDSTATAAQTPAATIEVKGKIEEESRSVKAPSESEPPSEVVRKVKTASDYFNTLAVNEREPKLIKAIIDENIKAVDGSRVRLRLLDDVEINECVVKRGSYLYATMSGFSSGRVKGNITSILIEDELVKVSLSLYDTDGMEGLYVPNSQFRETGKDVASGAVSGNLNMNTGAYGNSLSQWGMQTATNAYQKTSNAISKAIKKNKVKLKYGTFVYLVNGREKQ
jgi:conjugative transposon TraM protein